MHKLALLLTLALCLAVVRAQPPEFETDFGGPASEPAPNPDSNMLVFVSQRMFREEPLEGLRSVLTRHGYHLTVASIDTTIAVGMDQTVIRPDMRLADADPQDFCALVLVGGSGMVLLWDDSMVQARCREFAAAGRVIAAIGVAPVLLAKAGVLEGHTATVYPDHSTVAGLKAGGAKHSFKEVVTDRNVITASDTEHTRLFVQAVLEAIGTDDR